MIITARAEYACIAMIELAARYGSPKPVRLTDLTDPHGIPNRFVVHILAQMKSAGLVLTTRGPTGGYRLARPPAAITLADILNAIDRIDDLGVRVAADSAITQSLQSVWKGLRGQMADYLRRYSLADLIPASAPADYVI
jgi:Rrf2 family protein